jgi:hypothetical protein
MKPIETNLTSTHGMDDPDIKNCFHTFIIDQHLDKTLNNFAKWKEKEEFRVVLER